MAYIYVLHILYVHCGFSLQSADFPVHASTTMPFPQPETALAATIVPRGRQSIVCRKIARPAAPQGRPTTFQSLANFFNHFHEDSTTYKPNLRPACSRRVILMPAFFAGRRTYQTCRQLRRCRQVAQVPSTSSGQALRFAQDDKAW